MQKLKRKMDTYKVTWKDGTVSLFEADSWQNSDDNNVEFLDEDEDVIAQINFAEARSIEQE